MKFSGLLFLLYLCCSCSNNRISQREDFNFTHNYIYSNIAIPFEEAESFGIKVNGLWNGWGVKNPVASMHPLLWLKRFKVPEDLVSEFHSNNFFHGSAISSVYLDTKTVNSNERLKNAINYSITGQPFIDGRDQYYMCQNSEEWNCYLLNRARAIIDSGSNLLVFDEPFGDTIFGALPHPALPGFSEDDIDQFITCYNESDPENPISKETFVSLLSSVSWEELLKEDYSRDSEAYRLWVAYKEFQIRFNYMHKKALIDKIRTYSKSTSGREIPIGANLAGLENYSAFGIRMPVLYLADLFDFLACEIDYRIPLNERPGKEKGELFDLTERGKWFPFYSLGRAVTGDGRMLSYPSQELIDNVIEPRSKVNYFCHLIAEAYASGAGFVLPLYQMSDEDEREVKKYTKFIAHNPDLYESFDNIAEVGLIYRHGNSSSSSHDSYLSAAQALYESSIPFTTIFVPSKTGLGLNEGILSGYSILIIPFFDTFSEEDYTALNGYTENGGKIITLDRRLKEKILISSGIEFVDCSAYYNNYDDSLRSLLAESVLNVIREKLILNPVENNRGWTSLLYLNKKKNDVFIHLINYDYDTLNDEFSIKENLELSLNVEGLFQSDRGFKCSIYCPEKPEGEELPISVSKGVLSIVISGLDKYKVVKISEL